MMAAELREILARIASSDDDADDAIDDVNAFADHAEALVELLTACEGASERLRFRAAGAISEREAAMYDAILNALDAVHEVG